MCSARRAGRVVFAKVKREGGRVKARWAPLWLGMREERETGRRARFIELEVRKAGEPRVQVG